MTQLNLSLLWPDPVYTNKQTNNMPASDLGRAVLGNVQVLVVYERGGLHLAGGPLVGAGDAGLVEAVVVGGGRV